MNFIKKKGIVLFSLLIALMLVLSGCGDTESSTDETDTGEAGESDVKKIIKIGTTAVFESSAQAGVESLEDMGYKVEIIAFEDAIMPNIALMEGSIDANLFQHIPYMEGFATEKGADFTFLEPPFIGNKYAAFSNKYDDYNDLPNGAEVVLSSDASNKERSLNILQEMGLIKLADKPEQVMYSIFDIVENPKNLNFTEVSDIQVPTTLEDVDMIVVWVPQMVQGNYPTDKPLFVESDEFSNMYGCSLVVNTKDKDDQWVKDMMEAYVSDKTFEKLEDTTSKIGFVVIK